MCSVKGPNWADVNTTGRTKLMCWGGASMMIYLYSGCSQVSVFYWYAEGTWGLCYLEAQTTENVGAIWRFLCLTCEMVTDLSVLYFIDSTAGRQSKFSLFYFFVKWSCKWCFIQPFKWWHFGVTLHAVLLVHPSNIEQMLLRVNVPSQLSLTEAVPVRHWRV